MIDWTLMYKFSILGGTFAQFHKGHQKLLDTAFEQSEHVIVGISKESLYRNKLLSSLIEDYITRENYVKTYLQSKNWLQRTTFIPIDDILGNTLKEQSIEAIFVTKITYPAAEKINEKRESIGFPPLEIVTVPLAVANDGKPITSERVRAGEIDREGTVYLDLFKKTLTLPDTLRDSLRHPLGQVVKTTDEAISVLHDATRIISVGDIITQSLVKAGMQPHIAIIDHKNRRHDLSSSQEIAYNSSVLRAANEHGTISHLAAQMLQKALQASDKQILVITGEEDLLALPAILLAPLGSVVLYGQFDMGIVVNKVTEEKKREIVEIINKFS